MPPHLLRPPHQTLKPAPCCRWQLRERLGPQSLLRSNLSQPPLPLLRVCTWRPCDGWSCCWLLVAGFCFRAIRAFLLYDADQVACADLYT